MAVARASTAEVVGTVRDDAGGFDGWGRPGRGRDRLVRELGSGRLTAMVDAAGVTFGWTCEFELDL